MAGTLEGSVDLCGLFTLVRAIRAACVGACELRGVCRQGR
jgi:hypothetical protein